VSLSQSVAVLPRFQVEASRDLNYKVWLSARQFRSPVRRLDLNSFKYYFLRLATIPFNEQALEDDFGRLTKFLLSAPRDYFLYRDSNRANIMRRRRPFFLDYQGAARARCQYDIASSLYDAKGRSAARSSPATADHYRHACRIRYARREAFNAATTTPTFYPNHAGSGGVGFRGFYERKAHFLQSVPYALKNVRCAAA